MRCPWCGFESLEGHFIRLNDEMLNITWLQQVTPYVCQRCGAVEVGPYDVASGKQATLEELEKGYYCGANLPRVRRRKARVNPRRRRKRRDVSSRLHSEDIG